MARFFASACVLALVLASPAEAARHRHRAVSNHESLTGYYHTQRDHRPRRSYDIGPRPAKWCGWWMRTQKGGGPEYNLARNWANRGQHTQPRIGAVVVWPHHVGMITGRAPNGQWIVKSGNDSGRVRERPRSVAGAIAFRSM